MNIYMMFKMKYPRGLFDVLGLFFSVFGVAPRRASMLNGKVL